MPEETTPQQTPGWPQPDGEYRHNIHDLLIMVRSLMARLVEMLGPSAAEQYVYLRSLAASLPLTVTAEDHGDHGTALRIRLDGAAGEAHAPKAGRLARVEIKGFRNLGIVRVTETTLAGEPMLHAECDDGSSADFPPSSLHFITWLPEGALRGPAAAIPASLGDDDDPWAGGDDPEPGWTRPLSNCTSRHDIDHACAECAPDAEVPGA
jgi:hypothetical protein